MSKTILITGSTDGIGLEAAKLLVAQGHRVLVHGRNRAKLDDVLSELATLGEGQRVEGYVADLSRLADVDALARQVAEKHGRLDVLINNAGVFRVGDPRTEAGLDVRFMVNAIAPYRLTQRLLSHIGPSGRVVNLSSAAQAPVNLDALTGRVMLSDDFAAYAQSKLALTMWSRSLAQEPNAAGPAIIAVNPGSMLGTKMVREGFGVAGGDIRVGADILVRAALSPAFESASGQYFDNDSERFAAPHPDALDPEKCDAVVQAIERVLASD